MTQNRDLRATVGYKTDTASVAAAAAANTKVAASFATVSDAVARLGTGILAANPQLAQMYALEQQAAAGAQSMGAAAAQAAQQTTTALTTQKTGVQDLTALYKALEDQAVRAGAATAAAGGGGGSVGSKISSISRGLFNLPDVQLAPGLSTTVLSRLGLVAGGVADSLGLTATALGGLAAAGVGLGVVVSSVANQFNEAAKRAQDFLAAQAKIANLVGGGATREDLTAARDKALNDQKALQDMVDRGRELLATMQAAGDALFTARFDSIGEERQAAIQALQDDLDRAKDAIKGFFGLDPDALGSLTGINTALDNMQTQADNAQVAVAAANLALQNNATAAADAAEANRKLTERQIEAAQKTLALDEMTAAQRDKEVARNQRNIEILSQMIRTQDLSTDAAEQLAVQIGELTVRNRELNSVLTSTADLQEREKQFRDNAAKALDEYNNQLQIEGEALTRASEIQQRINDLTSDYVEKRRAAEIDAEEKRAEIVADGAERRQEIDRDDAERRAEIIKQFNRSYGDAIANRDALAAVKAKQQRDDELEKQDKAYKKAQDQLQKQLDKQLATVQKGLERQQRSLDDAYNRQRRALEQDLAQQYAIAQNARQQQMVMQQNYNQMIAQANLMHAAQQYKTIYDYGEMTYVYLDNLWRRIAAGAANLYNNAGYVVGGPDYGIYPGTSVGGNNLGSGGFSGGGGLLSRSTRPYLGGLVPSSNIMPMSGRGGAGLPTNVNVTVNSQALTRATVDLLWPPIRRKILDSI